MKASLTQGHGSSSPPMNSQPTGQISGPLKAERPATRAGLSDRTYLPGGRMERASEECGHGAGGPKSDIRLFFHTALTREAARSRPARLKWSHLLNTSATTLRRYSLNILKELGKV